MFLIPDPAPGFAPAIAARLVGEYTEFAHLKDGAARISILMRLESEIQGGRQVLGTAFMPQVQGRLNKVFQWMLERVLAAEGLPDFLIILDHDYWEGASGEMREILVFHELSHCIHKADRDGDPRYDEDGRPVWGLVAHDVEEFTATVARYGAYSQDIKDFIAAAQTESQNNHTTERNP